MNNLKTTYKTRMYFTWTLLLSWGALWTAVIGGGDTLKTIGIVGAGLAVPGVAFALLYSSKNRALVKDYWRRVFDLKRIKPLWWPVLLFSIPVLNVIAIYLSTFFGGSLEQLRFEQAFLNSPLVFVIFLFFFGPLPEELGWRGYGLEGLRSRYNLFTSSMILVVIWGLWHLPLFLLEGTFHNQLLSYSPAVMAYFLQLLPITILTNWVYYRTDRSTLAAIIFHFCLNLSGEMISMEHMGRILQMFVLMLVAIIVVIKDLDLFFDKNLEGQNSLKC